MTRPSRIVVVGDLITDVVAVLAGPLAPGSDTAAGIRVVGGGQAANTAAWIAEQGVPVTLVGAVGDDSAGRDRVAELERVGVRCAVEVRPDVPTGTVIVLATGDERTMVAERGANLRLTVGHVEQALAAAPDAAHLHLSGYPLLDAASRPAGLAALAAARGRGLTTSVDAASATPLRRTGAAAFLSWVRDVDLLLVNADEAGVLAGGLDPEAQARALSAAARRVVVKRGGAGAVWYDRNATLEVVPSRRVAVVDVTGAGDAFAAGLLAAWLAGAPPRAALTRASDLGALAVSLVGARPAG
ncbi:MULTISPECIES: carbohydrate kinase family protein [unclassified Micromonospora]|uniref:carbohydrate kinase family protein n=1 Tax=unclassified Micromonospora TaxID=2617518 RepID=UPI00105084A3|nr:MULTISPECIES: carbohydrate kinase family protein [unclassified Micromonospora]TDB80873.1 carbohydrate kinase family protein [Micromonospora sp. KC721]TDC42215.1 carbohydrate kinase family protein [Micromonospora sp. KC213]